MKKYLYLLIILLLCGGCASMLEESGFLTPSAVTSEYLKTDMAGFNVKAGEVPFSPNYFISLQKLKPIPEGTFVVIKFENPSDRKNPIIVEKEIEGDEERLDFTSPTVSGLQSYQGYYIEVTLYKSKDMAEVLGTHRQVIQSLIDERAMNRMLNK